MDTELRKAIWLSKAGALLLAGDASDLFVSTDGLRWEKLHWEPATFPPTSATEYGRPAEWIDTVAKSPTNEPQVRRSRRVVITSDTI